MRKEITAGLFSRSQLNVRHYAGRGVLSVIAYTSTVWKLAGIRPKVVSVKTDVTRPNWRERLGARFKTLPRPFIQFDETGMKLVAWHVDGSERQLNWIGTR